MSRRSFSSRLSGALIVLPLAFLLLPTLFIVPLALNDGEILGLPGDAGISLRHFSEALADSSWVDAGRKSIEVGLLAALLASVVGTAAALLLPGLRRRAAGAATAVLMVTLIVPPVVLAVAWYGVFSDLGLVGSTSGVVVAHAALGVPLVFLNVSAGLRGYDARLTRASRSLGAGPVTTFWRVTAPMIAPSVLAGALLTFVISFDELIVALFLGSGGVQTLPVVMWSAIRFGGSPVIAAVATIALLLTMVSALLVALSLRLARRRAAPSQNR